MSIHRFAIGGGSRETKPIIVLYFEGTKGMLLNRREKGNVMQLAKRCNSVAAIK